MPSRLLEEIAQTKLFAGVSLDAVEHLLDGCKVIELEPGAVLLEAGMPNDHLYLLLEGHLDIHLASAVQPCYMRLGAGECVGEMSMLEARETSAHVAVSASSRILLITRETMWSLIYASHALARNMLIMLSSRVRMGNEAVRDGVERQSEFENMAFVDSLTGLHNRRWLEQSFRQHIERSLHDGKPLTLLMIDIDHFKRFNDSYGHVTGDRCLRAVATALNAQLRPGDLLARYGGEEFAVLLPDTAAAQASATAERLRRAVADLTVPDTTPPHQLSISLGDTQLRAGDTLEKIVERADSALYLAKTAGRNCARSA